jgi:hypothetical protein
MWLEILKELTNGSDEFAVVGRDYMPSPSLKSHVGVEDGGVTFSFGHK